ncbi:MAG: PilZ domain-containing protein [Acidobacteria bacterium]|nr:PilZ domain-containing protein [Acidobacteriota bacterium]
MRLIAARLRQYVGNRRSARRYEVRLGCTVRLKGAQASATRGAQRAVSLSGEARDASATGLGLLMPAIHIGGHYLTGADSTLLIELELPAALIQVQAVAVRYERVEQTDGESHYHVGVRIIGMSEEDRESFAAYLRDLK